MAAYQEFEKFMDGLGPDWADVRQVAVGVSGGPDSMALCHMVQQWAKARDVQVHALTVDHGLRAESADEARLVGERLKGVQHTVLTWESPSKSAIQEEARHARYALMGEYCREHGISHLFLGHHSGDQAETVLFRLAKGSGLDGLCGMQAVQSYDDVVLVRPLLGFSKEDLVDYCKQASLDFVNDPSNEDDSFARVRLRQSRDILAEEGLSDKRLAVTAKRLLRARVALDEISANTFNDAALEKNTKHIVLNFKSLQNQPDEIVLRCVLRAFGHLCPDQTYAPRMEKVEALVDDLIRSACGKEKFRKRTLGGVIFELDDAEGLLKFSVEQGKEQGMEK